MDSAKGSVFYDVLSLARSLSMRVSFMWCCGLLRVEGNGSGNGTLSYSHADTLTPMADLELLVQLKGKSAS